MAKVPPSYSVGDIEKKVFKEIVIKSEEWKEHLGDPQLGNSDWLFMAESGHGKTTYTLQVVKELCKSHKVHYNSLEEGMKKGFRKALTRENMKSLTGFTFHSETLEQLELRLSRHKQPKIVVIDSVQYFFRGLKVIDYFNFRKKFLDTTFIWLSWADGKKPIGSVAEAIMFEADIVNHIVDFKAIVKKNRFEAYKPHTIWEDGYNDRQMILLKKS